MNTQIYEEATTWVVRHRLENLDGDAKRSFDVWLRQSPQHVQAYLEICWIWESVPALDAENNPGPEQLIANARAASNIVPLDGPATNKASRVTEVRRWREPRWLFALAATLVMCVGTAGWLLQQRGVYSTGIGEQRIVMLADGSMIKLDARSRIKVHYTARERAIDLLIGQALFQVAKDPSKPFVVASGSIRVRAVGTQFDLYRKSSGTLIAVVEGHVTVNSAHETQRPNQDQTLQSNRREILLAAGQQLLVAQSTFPTSPSSSEPQAADIDAVTAWTRQRFVFDFTPLAEVAEAFNRYNQRRLSIEDTDLRDFHISGSFSSTDLTLLLQFLRDQPGIAVEETANEIRISHRGSTKN